MSGDRITTVAEVGQRFLALAQEHLKAQNQRAQEARLALFRICAEVFLHLQANPTATANDVARNVPGRRQDMLRAVRELRAAQKRFQASRNRSPGEGSDRAAGGDGP